jgi:competence protein ComEC
MPFWDRSIDLIVLTHPDADHVTGLVDLLERYDVGGWLDNGQATSNDAYLQCQLSLNEKGIPHHAAQAGELLDLGQGWELQVLHPPAVPLQGTTADSNNNSVVLRLAGGGPTILLTGDIEAQAEALLARSPEDLKADVLKVAHHGSGGSSTSDFLQAVDPALAIVSVGDGNLAGHPAPETLQRLAELEGAAILRTDERGTIEVTIDAYGMRVRTER